jgi:glutaredoxin
MKTTTVIAVLLLSLFWALVAPAEIRTISAAQEQAAVIELYTTSWCAYCVKARDYLKKKGVQFREYDIEKDPEARRRKNQLNPGGGVPVAVIGKRVIPGFSVGAYDRALANCR